LVRQGKRETRHSRLKQDKGHQAELAAFVQSAREGTPAPIPFASLVQTTLATLRIRDALRSGQPQPVGWEPATAAEANGSIAEGGSRAELALAQPLPEE
jgi:hypothetical protein